MTILKRYRLALTPCERMPLSYQHVTAFNLKQALSLAGPSAVAVAWSPVECGVFS